MQTQKFRLYSFLYVHLLFQWQLEKILVLKIPQRLKTSKPASFDGSLHPGCCPFLSSWEHLPGHRKVVQLGASGGLYYRQSKMGVLAPNSIIWDYIWVQKLPFMGFAENHPPAWYWGSVFRRKASSLGLVAPQLFLLVQSRIWGPQVLAILP